MSEENKGTITIKKDTLWKYATFSLLGIIVLGAIFFILPGNSPTGNVVANNGGDDLPAVGARANLEIQEGDYIKGDADAPVVMYEFSDFECPFCQRNYQQAFPTIDSQYIETGKVAYILNHFPLNFHPQAQKAAEATECAGEQGKFWEMHALLFEAGVEGGIDSFKQYAGQLDLDKTQFDSCIDTGKYAEKVKSNMARGSAIGIQGTPGFAIGSEAEGFRTISGACPAQTFTQAIDAELEGKDWAVTNCQLRLL